MLTVEKIKQQLSLISDQIEKNPSLDLLDSYEQKVRMELIAKFQLWIAEQEAVS